MAQAGDVEVVQKFVEAAVGFGFALFADFQNGADVLFYGHFAEDGGFLRQVADACLGAFVYGQVAQFSVVEHDAACVGGDEPDYHVEAGGFACAVGTEQPDDFAAFDVQREIFDDLAFFEGLLQPLDVQVRFVHFQAA